MGTELGNVFEDLSIELDDVESGRMSLPPDELSALQSSIDETEELLAEVQSSQLLSMVIVSHVEMSSVFWLEDSAVAELRTAADPTEASNIVDLATSGIVLFESPVGRHKISDDADEEQNAADPIEVDIDGFLWWLYEYDPAAEDDDFEDDLEDDEELPAVSQLWLHVLSRGQGQRARLDENWRLPILVDADAFAIPLDGDDDGDEQPDLPAGTELLARLAAAVSNSDGAITVSELRLPPAKQTYGKSGWPELDPLETVSIVSAGGSE